VLHDLGFGNRVVHVKAGPEIPLPKRELAGYIPEFVEGVRQFAAEKGIQYDVIHSHYWMSGLAAEALSDLWVGRHSAHVPHPGRDEEPRGAHRGEREGAYRLDGERRVLKRADRVIAATPAEQAQLEWLYKAEPRKITVSRPAWIPVTFTLSRQTRPGSSSVGA